MLRIVTGLATVAAIVGSLGCGGGGSDPSSEQASSGRSTVAHTSAASKPVVTKEYFEDLLSEQDPYAPDYRYWDYTFDFGDRKYLARVYTDEPEVAYVDLITAEGVVDPITTEVPLEEAGGLKLRDAVERANLRAILRHLTRDGWRSIRIHTLGEEGYEPLPLD